MLDIDAILDSDGALFRTMSPDGQQSFTYRLLSMKEYKVFAALRDGGAMPPFQLYEMVFDRCHLGKFVPENTRAGIVPSIGQWIMWLSGDCDSETLKEDINLLREMHPGDRVSTHQMAVITRVFPYKLEEIEGWSRPHFQKMFVIAENILSIQAMQNGEEYHRLDTSKLLTPEQMERLKKKQQGGEIDFNAENRSVRKAMGPGNVEEEEAYSNTRARVQGLSQAQAARLQQMRG
jgi:hypothetical protein